MSTPDVSNAAKPLRSSHRDRRPLAGTGRTSPRPVARRGDVRTESRGHAARGADPWRHDFASTLTSNAGFATVVSSGGESKLRIEGACDALTVSEIRPAIDAIVANSPRRVVVDLDGVSLLDSRGVSAIISLWSRVKAQGGTVLVVRAHDQPLAVLKVLKLDAMFGVAYAHQWGQRTDVENQ